MQIHRLYVLDVLSYLICISNTWAESSIHSNIQLHQHYMYKNDHFMDTSKGGVGICMLSFACKRNFQVQ